MEYGKADWRTFDRGIEKEWLLTNGIGGFASSTIIGANTRRYHGLLVASLHPPVERHLIVSKIDESLHIGENTYNLYSFKTFDYIMKGYKYLQRVEIDHIPTFYYNVEDVFVEKKICMAYGENTTGVMYRIVNGENATTLKLAPLINFRNYHHNSYKSNMNFKSQKTKDGVSITPYNLDVNIKINCNQGSFIRTEDNWFINMEYPVEKERGLPSTEDHYIPGYFEINIKPGEIEEISLIATIETDTAYKDVQDIINNEKKRIAGLRSLSGYKDEFALKLVEAADNFIVYRKSTNSKTILAGYPWFTDWGRDAMIALPGLTLATGRYNDAKEILYTFSKYVRHGLIPNMFPDEGQQPLYNTVDASLWYFEAINKYAKHTKDYKFIEENVYEGAKSIIEYYTRGTLFNIKMDEDGLITAGDENTQLTWMDAKVDNFVVTPRHGKAVEINALWYNALKIMEMLEKKFGGDEKNYKKLSKIVKDSYIKTFWNESEQCLFDYVRKEYKNSDIRPNQILAVSLSSPVIEGEKAEKIVRKVWKELYTAYGLKSLSSNSNNYKGVYIGDQFNRDSAYHQGTVWTWPLGHFLSAFIRVFGKNKTYRELFREFIQPFRDHMRDGCAENISEIFDGDFPHIPRGCFAQAWSVAEVLRVYYEYIFL